MFDFRTWRRKKGSKQLEENRRMKLGLSSENHRGMFQQARAKNKVRLSLHISLSLCSLFLPSAFTLHPRHS
jgi:hypothetical protein